MADENLNKRKGYDIKQMTVIFTISILPDINQKIQPHELQNVPLYLSHPVDMIMHPSKIIHPTNKTIWNF